MKKRIVAWVLLVGFVILLLNILVFRFYWQLSAAVYFIIMFAFLLTNGRLVNMQDTQEQDEADDVADIDAAGGADGADGDGNADGDRDTD